jgi:hypothetical protein
MAILAATRQSAGFGVDSRAFWRTAATGESDPKINGVN